ncbi:hypothetical protein [Paludisphaera soli]|uniref:hypothetical protein n=1 Tax=Paludisphaera soli TaxID=2712865 RepID=UPI0013EB3611|nr:hypothetical protein [Paludisphaera soli]
MSTRWTDPDFSDRPKPETAADRRPRFLGMRPAFAGVATPLLIVALAATALDRADRPSISPRPMPPRPPRIGIFPGPVRDLQPPRTAAIDPRMIVPARPGIDEAMIHQARPDVDPGMIVPAFPSRIVPDVPAAPAVVPLERIAPPR